MEMSSQKETLEKYFSYLGMDYDALTNEERVSLIMLLKKATKGMVDSPYRKNKQHNKKNMKRRR